MVHWELELVTESQLREIQMKPPIILICDMNKIEIHKGEKKYRCDFRKVSATISGLRNLPQIVESGGNIQSMLPALHSALKSYRVVHKQLCFKVHCNPLQGSTGKYR